MEHQEGTRRRFYTTVICALWSLITAGFGIPALLYLALPAGGRKQDDWVDAADASLIREGHAEEVVFRRNRTDGWRRFSEKTSAWVTRIEGGKVAAFAPQCTHLGCAYHWDEKNRNFLCPCHTSTFALDGRVLDGPAPRPLDRYESRVENGRLLLGRVIRSDQEA
jgi:menaquinol-cytochrome c reductase iron-sulfur subunit